jgi:hypothetical protein
LHEQFFVQLSSVQGPLPLQFIVHPLPAHDSVAGPDASAVTVQPPSGHEKVHGPLPWQTNSQPAAGHDREQGSEVTHQHICPGEQLVEFVVWVVSRHAVTTRARPRATATWRTMLPPAAAHACSHRARTRGGLFSRV